MKFLMKLFSRCGLSFLIAFPILVNSQIFPSLNAHQKANSGAKIISGGDFTLRSADGPLSLKDLRGKVVILFFGYTSCADVCPISLATIANVFSKLTHVELKRIQSLFISLDPERDTPERLRKFTGYFHPNIVGVTGIPEVVADVAQKYGVEMEKNESNNSSLGYTISHTTNIFVVGPDGEISKTFPHDIDGRPLLHQIKSLLKIEQS